MSEARAEFNHTWRSFNPQPYRPETGLPIRGFLLLLLSTGLTGVLVGLLAGIIGQWLYVVILFPILMGAIVGHAGAWAVDRGRVRSPLLGGLVGILGGCAAVIALHGIEYCVFEYQLREVPPEVRQIARDFEKLQPQFATLPPDVQFVILQLREDPEARETLAVHSLWTYIDRRAREGVELRDVGDNGAKAGLNLGYIGSYCYWSVDFLLIALIAAEMIRKAAARPFCSRCDEWKTETVLPAFPGSPLVICDAFESGDFRSIANHVASPGDAETFLATLFHCPRCTTESALDVRLAQLIVKKKGEPTEKLVCELSYPGEARESLEQAIVQSIRATVAAQTREAQSAADAESVTSQT